jgi:hypothetical protein
MADVVARDALRGREVLIDGEPATALGIAPNGALKLRRADGAEGVCLAGEIQLPRA